MTRPFVVAPELRRDFPVSARLLVLRLAETGDLPLAAIRKGEPPLARLGSALEAMLPDAAPHLRREFRHGGMQRLARAMGRELTRHMMRQNQYLPMPAGWDDRADELYETFLDEFAASADRPGEAGRALVEHQERLHGLLRMREGPWPAPDEPLCATYSPELQLRLLRLDARDMPGPVLDLGCGEAGALVHHLRALGRDDAWGVDALCETGGSLIRASWFEAPLTPGIWGTIIAHQSFSLHVLRAHLRGSEAEATHFARTYMRILQALKPGGIFAYAPAIPFFEDCLPTNWWEVVRRALPIPASNAPFQFTHVYPRSAAEAGTRSAIKSEP
jgi:SAM-dependent methyltransferase